MNFWDRLFGDDGFTPHGFCLVWDPGLIWLHAASDTLIGIAYYSIPIALIYFVSKRRDIAFGWIFWLFAAFIVLCGSTHFIEVITLWYPYYGIQGMVKAVTAASSVATAFLLWPLVPQALALPSPAQLRLTNEELAHQVERRDAAVESARRSEERYRLLIENITDYAFFMLDPYGVVTTWNTGAQHIQGYTAQEIVGQHFSIFFTPDDRDRGAPAESLEIALRNGKYESELLRVRKDGSRFWASLVINPLRDAAGHLVGYATLTRDITERRKTEAELEETRAALTQSQKMEAIGQLAGGVAHDLNNLLTVVIGNLDLAEREIKGGIVTPLSPRIDAARRAADGSVGLISKLLAFSRRQMLSPAITDVNALVSGCTPLLRSAVGERIELDVALAGGLWQTHIDRSMLESAMLNLALNARDAMPDGGKLTIETANVIVDSDYARSNEITAGPYVMLSVSDTGTGMDAATLARVFEPFYTTKPAGSGTGLGLSQVYGFVKQSGGHIQLYSEPGHGTVAKLYLPRLIASSTVAPAEPHTAPPAGHEVILVVEDNSEVRGFACDMLEQLGYEIVEAASAEDGLAILRTRDDIKLLFTDVILPGLNGRQLAEQAQALRPGLRVVFTSGYTQHAIVHQGRLDPDVNFIVKPYRLDLVSRKIREALDA